MANKTLNERMLVVSSMGERALVVSGMCVYGVFLNMQPHMQPQAKIRTKQQVLACM